MKKIVIILFVAISLSCATVGKSSSNYLEKGIIREDLIGSSFYMALGKVNVYAAGLIATKSVDTAVGLIVNKDSGEIQRIVTLQPASRDVIAKNSKTGTTIYGEKQYVIDDLKGGMSAIEIYKMKTWDETLSAVEKRAARL